MKISDYLDSINENRNNDLLKLISNQLLLKVLKKEFEKRLLPIEIFSFSIIEDDFVVTQSSGHKFSLNIYYLANLYKLFAADNQYFVSSQPGALSVIKYIDLSYVLDYVHDFELVSIVGAVELLNKKKDLV